MVQEHGNVACGGVSPCATISLTRGWGPRWTGGVWWWVRWEQMALEGCGEGLRLNVSGRLCERLEGCR
jgi:hypothetical protein